MLRQILERPVSVSIAALTLVILGFFSLLRLPVSLLPALERPRLVVTARVAEAARDDLIRQVVEPLERRLASLPGVLEVHSTIEDGMCVVRAETEWQTDVDRLRIDAERRLGAAATIDQLEVRVEAGDREPILRVAVLGAASPAARAAYADKVLIPELGRLPGAGRLQRLGGASLRPVVRPNAAALAAHGLTSRDLALRLDQVGHGRPAGRLRDGARVLPLSLGRPARSIAELAGTRFCADADTLGVSRPGVTLGDVASVAMEEVPDPGRFRRGGEDGVLVEVHRAPGANAVLLAREARETLAELRARAGAREPRLEVVRDASLEVTAALVRLAMAAALGLLLGTLVLRFMLGEWRPTVALAVVVPASIVATFGGFYAWGVALDAVSLAGLALAAGMLIDNSIVVLEAIAGARARRGGGEGDGASSDSAETPELEGTRQIAMALVASFLTTAVVFLPLIYLRGLARAFFGVQAFAIVTSLLVSLALSLTLTPVLARIGTRRDGSRSTRRGRSPFKGLYLAVLDRALARPWPVIAATLALLAGAGMLASSLPRELMPDGLSRVLAVDYYLPPGLDRDAAERRIGGLERAASDAAPESSNLVSIYRRREPPMRAVTGAETFGNAALEDPWLDGDRGELELTFEDAGALAPARRRLRQRLDRLPGIETRITVRRGAVATALERSSRGLEVELTASTIPRARRLAERVAAELRDAGARARRADGGSRPSWALAWDDWRLAQLDTESLGTGGLTTADLEAQVQAALGGFYAGRVDTPGAEPEILLAATRPPDPRLIPVRARARNGVDLPDIVPLAALARIERRLEPPPAERLAGRPAVRLAVDASPARVERILAGVPLGPDERLRLGGQAHEMRRSFAQLRLALALALVLVFLTVAALYESLTLPLVVMTTVPVAAAGALGALWLTGRSLNVMSFLGLILLAGIVVNNAIVLVHRARQLSAARRVFAVREAAAERYRPILMTTLTTLLGMVPLALLGGEGAEMRGALAVAVCGGLVTSLFAALFVVPVLHAAMVKRSPG